MYMYAIHSYTGEYIEDFTHTKGFCTHIKHGNIILEMVNCEE